jgi:hypothetical protein
VVIDGFDGFFKFIVMLQGWVFPTKKLFRGRRNRRNDWFVPAEENSRNSIPNHSAEEKKARNSVLWNKNRSKLSEFRSKQFRGREIDLKFRSVGKKEANSQNSVRKHASDKSTLSILFAGAGFFVKPIFSCHSVPFRALELTHPYLGMPRDDHFHPRNN